MASLTIDQLEGVAKAAADEWIIEDPTTRRLQRIFVTIGMHVPLSFLSEAEDALRNQGLSRKPSLLLVQQSVVQQRPPIPLLSPSSFHHTCKGVFDGFLGTNTGRTGILGEVANLTYKIASVTAPTPPDTGIRIQVLPLL
jgi:hypothetical protein